MFKHIKSGLLLACFISLAPVTFASASDLPIDERDKTIEERLSCFTNAAKLGIDWDEVCSNQPKNDPVPQVMEDPISLDAMIERLHAAADEMLSESVGNEVPAANVDEVYEKHSVVFGADHSVDDIVEEHGINEDLAAAVKTEEPLKEAAEAKMAPKKDFSKRKSGPFDEPDLMTDASRETTQVHLRTHSFDIGYEKYYYEYKEDSLNVNLRGWWDTVSAAYTYRPKQGDLLDFEWLNHYRLEGRYGSGDLDYSSGSTGTSQDDPNYMFETRALLGRDYYPSERIVFTPYVGYGFRFLVDASGGRQTSTGQYAYDRKSHYHYLPIGLDYAYQFNKDWRVVANAEFDYFISGWQKSYLSDAPVSGYYDVRNDQDHGYGVRGSFKLIKTTRLIDFSIEPFVRFWHIKDSEVSNAGSFDALEPENTTLESGVRAGVQF